MGYIYKITNLINQKIYIGQTIRNPNIRWNHHIEETKLGSQLKFHRALRKYGKDNFSWEVIEQIENDKLNEREIYWIKFYDSYKNGYNSTEGGDNPPSNEIKIICLETKKIYESSVKAYEDTGISKCHIAECARNEECRVTAGGFHWMHLDEYEEFGPIYRETKNEKTSIKVECISTGEIYQSILDASKKTGVNRSTIKRHCDNDFKYPVQQNWRYI